MFSLVCAMHFLSLPYFLSAEPITLVFYTSQSTAECKHCLSGNYFNLNFNSKLRILSVIMKTILTFQVIQIHKHYFIIVASQLIECCHAGNFGFPALILKYLNLINCSANFVQNCKIYSKKVLVDEISRIISSDKFSGLYKFRRFVFRRHCFGTQGIAKLFFRLLVGASS